MKAIHSNECLYDMLLCNTKSTEYESNSQLFILIDTYGCCVIQSTEYKATTTSKNLTQEGCCVIPKVLNMKQFTKIGTFIDVV